ncbi:hypothetical protein FACS189437_07880 [Bacteroidia bacterium]|nr:hypothetical protein FACS189437_07880 [Bacteroidia bacterium]
MKRDSLINQEREAMRVKMETDEIQFGIRRIGLTEGEYNTFKMKRIWTARQ